VSELPNSWAMASIGEVTSEPNQRVPAAKEEFIYIDIASVDRQTKRITSPQHVRGDKAPSRARKVLRTGDVLVSMTRPNLNAVALVSPEFDGQIASTGFDVLRPTCVESRWIFGIVRSAPFIRIMSELVQGALYPAVRSRDVRAYMIPVAPLPEQKRVSDKLDIVLAKIDACRERLDRMPQILKKFREAVLGAAVSGRLTEEWREKQSTLGTGAAVISAIADTRRRLGLKSGERKIDDEGIEVPDTSIPESWAWCRVGQIADVRLGGTPSRSIDSYWRGNIPWVSSGEVFGRVKHTRETIGKDGVANSNAKIYPSGSVLIAMIGEGKTRGQSAILDIPASTNQNVAGLVFDGAQINGEYVWLWALAQYEKTRDIGRGGNQPALNGAKVRALPIPVPSRIEQNELVRRVQGLLALADSFQRRYVDASMRLDKFTPSVLAKAFRGELVPQNPNDEPAGEMLERIRKLKNETGKGTQSVRITPRTGSIGLSGAEPQVKRSRNKDETAMSKTRNDEDVKDKPYLATLIRSHRGRMNVTGLFQRADLPVADFYKQLAWELDRGHLIDNKAFLVAS
jgi:type I restriction enzyme S subunit